MMLLLFDPAFLTGLTAVTTESILRFAFPGLHIRSWKSSLVLFLLFGWIPPPTPGIAVLESGLNASCPQQKLPSWS